MINVANILLKYAIWKYLYKMFMKFIHELWTLWQIFYQSIQFVGNLSQNQNSEALKHYCDFCGQSSTQLENLDKHIMGIHARQRNYKCVLCGKYILKSASLMIHIKIIHQDKEIITVITVENSILKWQIWRYISNMKNKRISDVILVKNSLL